MSDLVYYTPEQAAQILGLGTANYLREHIATFPHIRIAKQIRFTPEHVEAIAQMHERTPGPVKNQSTFGRKTRAS